MDIFSPPSGCADTYSMLEQRTWARSPDNLETPQFPTPDRSPDSKNIGCLVKFVFFFFLLTKQEILLGKGTWVESSRVREPRRTLPRGSQSRVLRSWLSFNSDKTQWVSGSLCPTQCLENTYTKNLFFIYLKFEFAWVSAFYPRY